MDRITSIAWRALASSGASSGDSRYNGAKPAALTDDPVDDLRTGWDLHIEFGVTHPGHYLLMYGQRRPGDRPPAAQRADDRLRMLVERAAAAGRLVVSVDTATSMIHAAGTGLTLHLIGTAPEHRDPDVSTRLREAILGAITGDAPPEASTYAQHATALRAALGETGTLLTAGERTLLGELLDRLVRSLAEPAATTSSQGRATRS